MGEASRTRAREGAYTRNPLYKFTQACRLFAIEAI